MADPKPLVPLTPIEIIGETIVSSLKAGGLSSKYLIQQFPDDPDAFDMADIERVALVQYTGSRYSAPDGNSNRQQRQPQFGIHLYLRSAGQPVRAPLEIDLIRMAVHGRKVQGSTLYMARDGLVEQNGSVWRYLIEVTCSAIPIVPLHTERPTPLMTDFTKTEGA